MKKLTLGLACITLTAFASFAVMQDSAATAVAQDSASEQDKQREAKIRKLMQATGAAEMGRDVMDQMLNSFGKMGAALPAGFIDKFKELAKPDDLVNMVVPIYMKHVDADTLDGAMKFFNSPVGKRWLTAQKVITKESMLAGQAWGKKLGMRVMQELRK